MSPSTKPVTLSLKVKVTGIGDTFVGFVAVEDTTTEGSELSYVLENTFEAVFPMADPFTAASAATLTSTSPAAVGVMLVV